jgi:hypothetical protein
MIFEMSTKGNGTILNFMHEGLIPQKECYAMCSEGWNKVIKEWLYNFITTGEPHFLV